MITPVVRVVSTVVDGLGLPRWSFDFDFVADDVVGDLVADLLAGDFTVQRFSTRVFEGPVQKAKKKKKEKK